MKKYDNIVIGGGPAGYAGAIRAAQAGRKVLLVEKEFIGGTCLNRGCIPTKALISSLRLADSLKKASGFGIGIDISSVDINYSSIQVRKEKIVAGSRKGIEALLKKWNIDFKNGTARFLSRNDVEIKREQTVKDVINAKAITITTGSKPVKLPMFPVDNVDILDSDTIHGIRALPKSLLIIGGGVIGCEFAYIFNCLGVDVSIVEIQPHILPMEDNEIASIVEREFKKRKIRIHKGSGVENFSKNGNSDFSVELSNGKTITVEKILVSIGRRPNTKGLDLENAGISVGKDGEIPVNTKMETVTDGIFAAGDVTGKYPFAYVASHEGIIAAENSFGEDKEIDYSAIPRVVFSEPELGCVGLSQEEAESKGLKVKIGKFPVRGLGRAHASGELTGLVKVICDAESDKILGLHMAGPHASEIVHVGTMAIKHGLKSSDIGSMFFAHPVFSEAILEASWDVQNKSIHKF